MSAYILAYAPRAQAATNRRISPRDLADTYERALRTATATRLQVTATPVTRRAGWWRCRCA